MTQREKTQIKATLRNVNKAFDDSTNFEEYKRMVCEIYLNSNLDWITYYRIVKIVCPV